MTARAALGGVHHAQPVRAGEQVVLRALQPHQAGELALVGVPGRGADDVGGQRPARVLPDLALLLGDLRDTSRAASGRPPGRPAWHEHDVALVAGQHPAQGGRVRAGRLRDRRGHLRHVGRACPAPLVVAISRGLVTSARASTLNASGAPDRSRIRAALGGQRDLAGALPRGAGLQAAGLRALHDDSLSVASTSATTSRSGRPAGAVGGPGCVRRAAARRPGEGRRASCGRHRPGGSGAGPRASAGARARPGAARRRTGAGAVGARVGVGRRVRVRRPTSESESELGAACRSRVPESVPAARAVSRSVSRSVPVGVAVGVAVGVRRPAGPAARAGVRVGVGVRRSASVVRCRSAGRRRTSRPHPTRSSRPARSRVRRPPRPPRPLRRPPPPRPRASRPRPPPRAPTAAPCRRTCPTVSRSGRAPPRRRGRAVRRPPAARRPRSAHRPRSTSRPARRPAAPGPWPAPFRAPWPAAPAPAPTAGRRRRGAAARCAR